MFFITHQEEFETSKYVLLDATISITIGSLVAIKSNEEVWHYFVSYNGS